MRPGEWGRHLDAEQRRSAVLGRQWHVQRRVDIGMAGADELDNTRELDAILEEANRPTLNMYDPAGLALA